MAAYLLAATLIVGPVFLLVAGMVWAWLHQRPAHSTRVEQFSTATSLHTRTGADSLQSTIRNPSQSRSQHTLMGARESRFQQSLREQSVPMNQPSPTTTGSGESVYPNGLFGSGYSLIQVASPTNEVGVTADYLFVRNLTTGLVILGVRTGLVRSLILNYDDCTEHDAELINNFVAKLGGLQAFKFVTPGKISIDKDSGTVYIEEAGSSDSIDEAASAIIDTDADYPIPGESVTTTSTTKKETIH